MRNLYFNTAAGDFPHQFMRSIPLVSRVVRGLGIGLERGNDALRDVLTQVLGERTMESVYRGAKDCVGDPDP